MNFFRNMTNVLKSYITFIEYSFHGINKLIMLFLINESN